MNLFDLPPEVVQCLVDAVASSRALVRVMRLRLVSRTFKEFIERSIFRLRLLEVPEVWERIPGGLSAELYHTSCRNFVVEYLAYHALAEQNPASLFGRIKHAAFTISEQLDGKSPGGPTTAKPCAGVERLKSLLHLAFNHRSWINHAYQLLQPGRWHQQCSKEEHDDDIAVAAVYLGHQAHIQGLISQGVQFCYWGEGSHCVKSGVFGEADDAAALSGDVSMIRLILTSSPFYNPSEPIPFHIRKVILLTAAQLGHKDAFNFALDCGPLDLASGELHRNMPSAQYRCVTKALAETPVLENYLRGAALFGAASRIFKRRQRGRPEDRLIEKATAGHARMVEYFLDQGAPPNVQVTSYDWFFADRPILRAVQGGSAEVVKLLLERGADPNCLPAENTPLMMACRKGNHSAVKLLLEAGANVDDGLPPPIVTSVFKEDVDLFRLLREHGARLDTPETGGWAMAVAQFYAFDSMINLLVRESVDAKDLFQRCPGEWENYTLQWMFPKSGFSDDLCW